MKADWQTKSLGELCEIARGGSPRPIQDFLTSESNGINWIKISDATASGKYIYKTQEKIRPEGIRRSRLVHEGDFLLSNSMSFGRPYILKTSGCIHDGWLVLSDKSGLFDQEYLYYFLGSDAAYRQFDHLAAGSTVRNLNTELVKKVQVVIPPLPEQRRIVAILDEAFQAIATATANAEKNLANVGELFDELRHLGVSGRLKLSFVDRSEAPASAADRPQIEQSEIPFDIPSNWRWCRFGSLVRFLNGDRGKNYPNKAEYTEAGVPWINTGHIRNDGGLDSDSMNYISRKKFDSLNGGKIQPGDLVYCLRGATIGKTAFVDPYFEGAVASSLVIIRPGAALDRRYAYHFLTSRLGRELIKRFDNGAAQPNLAGGSVARYVIPLPPLSEQREIVRQLDEFARGRDALTQVYHKKIALMEETKEALLRQAFAGRLSAAPSSALDAAAE